MDVDATGASGVSRAIAGRLRQLASDAREDRTAAVNGGNVRYHGGSAAGGAVTAAAAVTSPSEDWSGVSPTGCDISVLADREADL